MLQSERWSAWRPRCGWRLGPASVIMVQDHCSSTALTFACSAAQPRVWFISATCCPTFCSPRPLPRPKLLRAGGLRHQCSASYSCVLLS